MPNNIAETPSPAKFEQNEPFPFIVNKHIKPVVIENLGSRKESLRAIFQGAVKDPGEQEVCFRILKWFWNRKEDFIKIKNHV